MLNKGKAVLMAAALVVAATPAKADVATDWWELAHRYYLAGQGAPGPRTPDMERATTRTALAMFEAVNAIDRRYQSYLGTDRAEPSASQDAAVVAAAHAVLVRHYPARKAALDESRTFALAAIPEGPARDQGVAIGEKAAEAAMGAGGIDPAVDQTPSRPEARPGVWIGATPSSLDPYWRAFKPWGIGSADALRPPPPPAMGSERYGRDVEEVRRLGGRSSQERSELQTLVARYRQAFDIAPSIRFAMDRPGRRLVDKARFLALFEMAYDDAVQAMIVAKQHYGFWRPITAIRNADRDDNAATQRDPAWVPLVPTPNFEEYPCGHCAVAGVIAETMKSASGWPAGEPVRVGSMLNPDSVLLTVADWDRWAADVSNSRLYGGVHYRFSNEAGEALGREAARRVMAGLLPPVGKSRR